MRIGAGGALLLALLCAACFGGAAAPTGEGSPEAEDPAPAEAEASPHHAPEIADQDVAAFSERIQAFYSGLEDVPLDALVTFENKKLRDCFETPAAFSDYFSALATEARDQSFRDGAAKSVRVVEFQFDSAEEAWVHVRFTSNHQRVLRFWSIGFDRFDSWRRTDGIWRIVPAKL